MPLASSRNGLPRKHKFFFDEHLPLKLAEALSLLCEDAEICHLRRRFGAGVKDVEWLEALGSEPGWILVIADTRIRTRPHERCVLERYRFRVFVLAGGWANLRFWEQAWRLVRWWPIIMETAERLRPGEHYEVPVKAFGPDKLRLLSVLALPQAQFPQ